MESLQALLRLVEVAVESCITEDTGSLFYQMQRDSGLTFLGVGR